MSRWSDRAAARTLALPKRPPRPRWRTALLIVAGVVGIVGFALWQFAGSADDAAPEAAQHPAKAALHSGAGGGGEPVLRLTAAVQRQNGIETAILPRKPYQQQIRAYGAVLDLSAMTALGNKFADANAQVEIGQAKLAASKAAANRAQILFRNEQNVSRAEMQGAEASFRADQAALAAAQAQLHNLAVTAVQDWGVVLGKELADNGPLAARLMNRDAYLVQVSLPPGAALAAPPQAATIDPGSGPSGARVPIRFVSPASRVDPKIQGLTYLYVVPAGTGVLPGMDVVAVLPDGRAAIGIRVPASAIVWWRGRTWVYLRSGPDTFARREIPTSEPDAAGGYIVRNLPPRAEIVTSGAQSLLSEEFRAQIDVDD